MSGAVTGPVIQATTIDQIHLHAGSAFPAPSQLLPAPPFFTAREHELSSLDAWLVNSRDRTVVAVVTGPGGVGKTALALHWLHRTRTRFPDGQLYVDLGAFDSTGPATPGEVLEWFLLALGLPADRMPTSLPQRAGLYRSLTENRAVAVLLDNALSVAQVRPLLPVSSSSVAVVTSRWRLAGLRIEGARFLDVEPLDIDESVRLLDRLVGDDRVAVERPQAEDLARLCGGLPLALSVVGARLTTRPNRLLSRELGALNRADRLAAMSVGGEPSVRAILDMSYAELSDHQARIYRTSALHPGHSFGVEVVAAGVDRPADEVGEVLDALVDRNLIAEIPDQRFQFHDLLRLHAEQCASTTDPAPTRLDTVRRMVEWYLDMTVSADLVLRPTRRRIGSRFQSPPRFRCPFDSRREAIRWLEAERGNLVRAIRVAAEQGWDQMAWEFCEALWGFLIHTRHYDMWLEVHQIGIPAAQRSRSRPAEARLRTQLASALVNLRRYSEARHENLLALEFARQADDDFAAAAALSELAGVAQGEGDLVAALDHLHEALAIRNVIGTQRAVAVCRRRIGEVLCELGRLDEAVSELTGVATMLEALDDVPQRARALTSLGIVYLRQVRLVEAERSLSLGLDLIRAHGLRYYEAVALEALGDVAEQAGDLVAAARHWSTAYEIYASTDDPHAMGVADKLARVTDQAGDRPTTPMET
jgi:tetratricopeptide (TPR) repeat protein